MSNILSDTPNDHNHPDGGLQLFSPESLRNDAAASSGFMMMGGRDIFSPDAAGEKEASVKFKLEEGSGSVESNEKQPVSVPHSMPKSSLRKSHKRSIRGEYKRRQVAISPISQLNNGDSSFFSTTMSLDKKPLLPRVSLGASYSGPNLVKNESSSNMPPPKPIAPSPTLCDQTNHCTNDTNADILQESFQKPLKLDITDLQSPDGKLLHSIETPNRGRFFDACSPRNLTPLTAFKLSPASDSCKKKVGGSPSIFGDENVMKSLIASCKAFSPPKHGNA